jgi:rubrerythrin
MPQEENDHDSEFLDFFERLTPKCQSLRDLIRQEVQDLLSKAQPQPQSQSEPERGSHSYLERQNAMLLNKLLGLGEANKSTQVEAPPSSVPGPEEKPQPQLAPVAKPKPFWK